MTSEFHSTLQGWPESGCKHDHGRTVFLVQEQMTKYRQKDTCKHLAISQARRNDWSHILFQAVHTGNCYVSFVDCKSQHKKVLSFRELCPLTRGSAPGPCWGHSPQTSVLGSCSTLAINGPIALPNIYSAPALSQLGRGQQSQCPNPLGASSLQHFRSSFPPCKPGAPLV